MALQATDDWLTYTHRTWGISFRYPPDWEVEGPESMALGNPIVVHPIGSGWRKIEISLDDFTLSAQGSLETWVRFRNEGGENSGLSTDPLHLSTLSPTYLPAEADEAIYSIGERDRGEIHTLWLASNGLVYRIRPFYSQLEDITLVYEIAASLEFDPIKQKSMRATADFAGDEETLRQLSDSLRATPEAARGNSPLPTPTPNGIAPNSTRRQPTPTPPKRATAIPSTSESP
jgi:hypothetical protein